MNLIKKEEEGQPFVYTEDQLMARLRFFIGVCLALTLTGIVFVVLYSIIFVTQPLNAISPIDQKFFELIIPIATFLTGTLSGIMLASKDNKEAQMKALEAATRQTPVSSAPTTTPATSSFSMPKPMSASPFTAPAPVAQPFTPQVTTGYGGKEMPVQPPQPEL